MNSSLRLVLDTNVFLVSILPHHKYWWLFQALYYNWQLIHNDPDDDKFVDSAVAGQVDFIVTHDKHFNVLEDIPFPKVNIIRLEKLEKVLAL